MANNYRENVSAEELKDFDLSWFKGKIVIVDNPEKFREIICERQKEIKSH